MKIGLTLNWQFGIVAESGPGCVGRPFAGEPVLFAEYQIHPAPEIGTGYHPGSARVEGPVYFVSSCRPRRGHA